MCKKFLWVIALTSSLMFNQMVLADTAVCREGLDKMVQSISLNDAQKTKVKPILDQQKSDLQAAGSQMNDLETQISQQVNSANMYQDTVNSLVDNKAKLIGDKIKAKIKAKNQIFSILNPQQKEKLQGIIKAEDEKMKALYKNCDRD